MTVKLKGDDLGAFDPDELDVEWSESDYQDYTGEQPPTGTTLRGGIKKIWWTFTAAEDPMIKALWVAEGNTGALAEYNGLPIWENIVFTPKAAFKYGPFLQILGLTLKQIKTQMYVADEDDNIGVPIERIGKVAPGTEATECGVIVKRRKWNGEWQTNIGKLIEQPDLDEDDEDEEEEAPRSTRGSRKAPSKPAAKSAPARRRRAAEPEEEEDEEEDEPEEDEEEEDEPPAKPARRAPARKPAAKTPAKKPAARRKPADDDDEDPF
jgi:hypothetical protein